MTKKEISKLSLEETFALVDETMQKMSQDDIPLEDSFNLYKDGMELINHCNEVIDGVEKQIMILKENDEQ